MELRFKTEYLAFQEEVRGFLRENLCADLRMDRRDSHAMSPIELSQPWQRILFEKGWAAPGWPKEYGGAGWSEVQKYIFNRECWEAGAPMLAPFGLQMCGPVLMAFGTEEQKSHYLPRILSTEDYWCQGYSEPGAGSDLASLKTRAENQGDHYLVNGHKIWTTHAHHANRIFLLTRTRADVKAQAGISFLLVDMESPGIEVKPIITLAGDHEVNEVFFTDVKVPKTALVGEENQGWTIAKYLLSHERSGAYTPMVRQVVMDLRRIASVSQGTDGGSLKSDPDFVRKLAEIEVETDAIDMIERRIMVEISNEGDPGTRSSMQKALGTELLQRVTHLYMETLNYYAVPNQKPARITGSNEQVIGPEWAIAGTAAYLNDRAPSIYGGSNEVQRNIIAKMVLGL